MPLLASIEKLVYRCIAVHACAWITVPMPDTSRSWSFLIYSNIVSLLSQPERVRKVYLRLNVRTYLFRRVNEPKPAPTSRTSTCSIWSVLMVCFQYVRTGDKNITVTVDKVRCHE